MAEDRGEPEQFPRTVEEAVQLVLERMTDRFRTWLRDFAGDEIALRVKLAAGMTPGMNVRAMLGLWGKNPELLARLPRAAQHPDDASSFILVECWRRLREGQA